MIWKPKEKDLTPEEAVERPAERRVVRGHDVVHGLDVVRDGLGEGGLELRHGDPADPGTTLGPVVGPDATARFDAAIADAQREGTIAVGGTRDGNFVQPTLVTGLPQGHRLTREELFLPFLTVTTVPNEPPVWTIMPPPTMMAPGMFRTPACGIPG